MSCRIIGRLLDRALFCESLSRLRKMWPFAKLRASFIPTPKNGIVSGLWRDYGFSRIPAEKGKPMPVWFQSLRYPSLKSFN